MKEAWIGNISKDDPSICLDDIHLLPPSPLPKTILRKDAKLHFLSIVDVQSIPLYLIVGPSLDVATDNKSTAAWLSETLLVNSHGEDDEPGTCVPWCSAAGRQSNHGILVKIEENTPGSSGGQATELLFHACVKTKAPPLPSPPASSSPRLPQESLPEGPMPDDVQDVRLYALPLDSRILDRIHQWTGLIPPPSEACFLPDRNEDFLAIQIATQKRQSLSSLFEEATQKKRKFKGRGGEGISHAMAEIHGSSHHDLSQEINREEQAQSGVPKGNASRRTLLRASTIASFSVPECSSRPVSRGALANGKRSSLHRVESAVSPRDSPTLSDLDSSYAQQNKATLAKVVMAGMRLNGLQQKKRPPPDERPLTGTSVGLQSEGEDEYKLVYHQTFKAAVFAFRRQLNIQIVGPEVMRDVIDRLLNLFCTDPMVKDPFVDDSPGSSFQQSQPLNIFDLPSAGAMFSGAEAVWNTPRTKRR